MSKNYCAEIDSAIKRYESLANYQPISIHWICDRIAWCYQYKHITKKQMEQFADRITKVIDSEIFLGE